MNLPAGVVGNIVSVVDYTNTFQTNNLTISPNGTDKIGGINSNSILSTEGQSITLVYVDATEGWKNIQDSTSNVTGIAFICASVSGACNTLVTAPCCANVKIATFTGPGDFTVNNVASSSENNTVGYMVVAGGGAGGGGDNSGGGGAGGFREGRNAAVDNFTASPLVANAPTNALIVTATTFPITVGGGGTGNPGGIGGSGSNSTFSTIIATGGGGGGTGSGPTSNGLNGGSGGGGGHDTPGPAGGVGGTGNTPTVSPPQGTNGGTGNPAAPQYAGAGGGGTSAAGANGSPTGGTGS